MDWLFNSILDWFAGGLLRTLDVVITLIGRALLVSPDVTALPQVKALAGRSVWVVDTVFVLAFIAAAAVTMLGGDERRQHHAKDLLPRLVVGFVAAHFSQLLCAKAIAVANGAAAALGPKRRIGGSISEVVREHIKASLSAKPAALLLLVILAVIIGLVAVTALGLITRLAVLLVLTAIAPLALACHALPYTEPLARLWWRAFGGCLITPVLQAFCLQAGQWMLTDPDHTLPPMRLPGGDPAAVFQLFVVVVLLATTARIPGLVRRHVMNGGGARGNVIGAVVRIAVLQHLTRALPGLRTAARAVTR